MSTERYLQEVKKLRTYVGNPLSSPNNPAKDQIYKDGNVKLHAILLRYSCKQCGKEMSYVGESAHSIGFDHACINGHHELLTEKFPKTAFEEAAVKEEISGDFLTIKDYDAYKCIRKDLIARYNLGKNGQDKCLSVHFTQASNLDSLYLHHQERIDAVSNYLHLDRQLGVPSHAYLLDELKELKTKKAAVDMEKERVREIVKPDDFSAEQICEVI